jgi:hypothetical protein
MFRLPIDEEEAGRPIILPDVTVAEFNALLKFFYEGYVFDSTVCSTSL